MTSILGDTIEKLQCLQKRCINCSSTNKLEIHHRFFRSEGSAKMLQAIADYAPLYTKSYNRILPIWHSIHDIQNLCILCSKCHSDLHRGNNKLRVYLRNSFTCPKTGFNIPYFKKNKLY